MTQALEFVEGTGPVCHGPRLDIDGDWPSVRRSRPTLQIRRNLYVRSFSFTSLAQD